MKTKDIMKILKLVKKAKKHKKRKRHHSKKKVIITPTQNIQPSALQPYEISRQVPMTSTNNLSLDNLRLNNTLLENKIKEGPEINNKLNDLNTKLLLNETNTNALNNQFNNVNQQLLNIGTANQSANTQLSNQLNNVRQRLIGFDNTNQGFNNIIANQDIRNQLAITNFNKNLEDKIDDIWRKGPQLVNEAINRKFSDNKLIDRKPTKIINDTDDDDVEEVIDFETKKDDDKIDELLITPPGTPPDKQSETPLEPPPNIQTPPPEKKAKKKKDSKLPPPPDIQQQPDNLSTAEKKHNMKIDEIINKIQNDDNGEVLDTKSKLIYFNMYKSGKISYPNSSKTKSSIIDNLLKKKFS